RSAKGGAGRRRSVRRAWRGRGRRCLAAPRNLTLVYKPVYIHKIVANLYRDSVSLMQLSAALAKRPGVEQASAVMATPANLDLLREAGLMDAQVGASPNDLLIAVSGKAKAPLEAALAAAVTALDKAPAAASGGGPAAQPMRSLQMALAQAPQANLALVSVPGEYAA